MSQVFRIISLPDIWRALREVSPRGRMMRGIAANIYDKSAITIVQLGTIPLLTNAWGAEGYGVWLTLMTIPTFLALSDFGLGTAAGVAITQHVAQGKYEEALEVLQSTIAFVLSVVSMVAICVIGCAFFYAFNGSFLVKISATDVAFLVALIAVYSLITTQISIMKIVLRATHKYAFATVYSGTLFLVDGLVLIALVALGQNIVAVAAVLVVTRAVAYVIFIQILRRFEPWVVVGIRKSSWATIKILATPSLAALALTFSNAVIIQGMLLSVGALGGAAAAAVFGASRTISRVPLQLSGLVLRPSLPELTRSITDGNHELTRHLNRVNALVALAATIPFGLALVVFGPVLLSWLSRGELVSSNLVFALLAASAVFNALWAALATPLIAMNRQAQFSFFYLVVVLLAVGGIHFVPSQHVLAGAGLGALAELLVLAWLMRLGTDERRATT